MEMITLLILLLKIAVAASSLTKEEDRQQCSDYGQPCKGEGPDGGCISKDIKNPLQCGPSGRCDCAPGLYFCPVQNRCVSPPGGLCTTCSRDGLPIRTCTDFATCWPNDKIFNPEQSRLNGTCYCEPDAMQDSHTGRCKLRHGSTRCVKLDDCDVTSLISCRYGSCQCHDETFGAYNSTTMRCESLVGGCCGVQSNPPFPAAVCHEPEMKCVEGKCVCEEGYGQTYDKRCMKITTKTHVCRESSYPYPGPIMYAAGGGGASASFDRASRSDQVIELSDENSKNNTVSDPVTGTGEMQVASAFSATPAALGPSPGASDAAVPPPPVPLLT